MSSTRTNGLEAVGKGFDISWFWALGQGSDFEVYIIMIAFVARLTLSPVVVKLETRLTLQTCSLPSSPVPFCLSHLSQAVKKEDARGWE